jgi:hypothetical protein
MNLLLVIQILTSWEILLVALLCIILLPLVTYLSSLRPRRRRMEFMPPAERALMEAPDREAG